MKVLAIASVGGHWIQLLRLIPAFKGSEVVFVSTKQSFGKMVSNEKFYAIADGNRSDKKGLFKAIMQLRKIFLLEKPNVVITTGAAPGLMAIFIGKLFKAKTIWVDSIANCEELSMSCKIAKKVADHVYTQWPHLADDKVKFKGNVLK
ncbi:hypothetical protein [Zunongwangia pacifica]|uniref:Oligosaccharide biosynthesis protein Alg14 n=1 Tax=Zunongwangia pacifica TaxID=2911062 RepID=A0A9X1ZUT6_9FLAO|nr:hypothetical protein [Zunongwangia pacifica]MCL6216761.1 hypothetical protein [Zunongwangia pacifica]